MCAAPPLVTQPVAQATAPDTPARGNVLTGLDVPPGTTLRVSGFKVPGSTTAIVPGGAPVAVVDQASGTVTGTLAMATDGSYTFDPSPSFAGVVPPVVAIVTRSDGVSREVPLSLTVNAPLKSSSSFTSAGSQGGAVQINVLGGATSPGGGGGSGNTVSLTGFSLPGSAAVLPVGAPAVAVPGTATDTNAGSVAVSADGTITFTPAAGYSGQVPPITYTAESTDGQRTTGSASVVVPPGMLVHGCGAAIKSS